MRFSTTGKNKILAEKCCIVFEAASGKICHVHRAVTMAGASERTDKAIADRALELAKKHGAGDAQLDVIHVDPKVLETRGSYHVDVKNRALVGRKT